MSDFDPADPPRSFRFDFAAADAAVEQLATTIQSLMEALAVYENDIPTVTEDWSGRFREVFDIESARYDLGARELANGMLTLAVAIRARAIEAAAAWTP